jgi:acetyl-CoA carboxylase biotin carboxyl carrier protein
MEIDKKIILRLVQVLEDLKKSLKGIEIQNVDDSVEEQIEISGTAVKSPIVGTAYLAPEPGGKQYVEIGKKIKKGETIMIVEAMKTMNHIPSPSDGIVKEISVEDGQPVEFGQKLLILE